MDTVHSLARQSQRLIIPLERIQSTNAPVYVGDHVRDSTATSAVILNDNTLACCHFDGRRIFLIRFDIERRTYSLLHSLDTTYGGRPCETDLMAGDGAGNLVTTNFFLNTCSIYRFENDRIRFIRDLGYDAGNRVHGVKFFSPDIIAVTSRGRSGGVHFFDVGSSAPVFVLSTPGQGAQDLCFLSSNRLVMISTLGHPALHARQIYSSVIQLIEFSIYSDKASLLRRRELRSTHLDSIVMYQDRLYVTDQYNNKVIVIDPVTLDEVDTYQGYDFCHGIDVNFGVLAVSNYGDNTIVLQSIADGARGEVPGSRSPE